MTLVHWTYTKEEWRTFLRRSKKQKGFLSWLFKRLSFMMDTKIPEVKITPEKVTIGNDHQHFSSERFRVKKIDIRDEGKVNVLTILYRQNGADTTVNEISVPVPKGKLREAMLVQERLNPDC